MILETGSYGCRNTGEGLVPEFSGAVRFGFCASTFVGQAVFVEQGGNGGGTKEYAREPRSLLGLIPNRAPFHGRAYKLLAQGDLVKQEKNEQDEA